MGSFGSRVQVELPDRPTWTRRLKLATTLREYLELFHHRQHRHSSLSMLTPSEFEARQEANFDEHRSIRPVLGPTERRALRSLHNTRGVQSPLDQSDSPVRRAEDIWLEAPLLAVGAGELGSGRSPSAWALVRPRQPRHFGAP
jgi:hypothetical protein